MDKFTDEDKQDMVNMLFAASVLIRRHKIRYICPALAVVSRAGYREPLRAFLCFWIEQGLQDSTYYEHWESRFGKGGFDRVERRLRWIHWMIAQIKEQTFNGLGLPTSVSFAEAETAWFSSARKVWQNSIIY